MTALHDNYHCDAMLVLMLFQTVIEVVYKFLLPKFIEECKRQLSDGAADSKRCMGLCTHCTCQSTMSSREQSAND